MQHEILQEDEFSVVPDSLVELSTRLAGGHVTSAPVKMPERDELTVCLVNISIVQRLDELRGDQSLMLGIFLCVVGGLIGFLTSVYTSSSQGLDKQGWILLTLLCAFAAVFGALTVRAAKRAEALRRKIFDEAVKRTSSV